MLEQLSFTGSQFPARGKWRPGRLPLHPGPDWPPWLHLHPPCQALQDLLLQLLSCLVPALPSDVSGSPPGPLSLHKAPLLNVAYSADPFHAERWPPLHTPHPNPTLLISLSKKFHLLTSHRTELFIACPIFLTPQYTSTRTGNLFCALGNPKYLRQCWPQGLQDSKYRLRRGKVCEAVLHGNYSLLSLSPVSQLRTDSPVFVSSLSRTKPATSWAHGKYLCPDNLSPTDHIFGIWIIFLCYPPAGLRHTGGCIDTYHISRIIWVGPILLQIGQLRLQEEKGWSQDMWHKQKELETEPWSSPDPLGHLSAPAGDEEFLKHIQIPTFLEVKRPAGNCHSVAKNKGFPGRHRDVWVHRLVLFTTSVKLLTFPDFLVTDS